MHDDPERVAQDLQQLGDRLREARSAEREILDAIAGMLSSALAAGVSKREIARRTGLSRPWIDHLLNARAD